LGGSGRLKVPSMPFENEQTNGRLTREALALWLVDHNRRAATHPGIAAVAGEVCRVLRSAGDGSPPGPSHHGHTIEQGGRRVGHFMPFRTGFGLSLPGWLWVLAWPVACFAGFRWIQQWFRRRNSPT
jgi:hypothetical protein